MKTDILIVGCGVAGLYCALNLPEDKNITIVTKNIARKSDSFLAQGGICVLRDEEDHEAFFEDTMKAGHYENNPESVEIMIQSSQDVIADLVSFGVRFEKNGESFTYTREGAHSRPRILFHEDETGKEITSQWWTLFAIIIVAVVSWVTIRMEIIFLLRPITLYLPQAVLEDSLSTPPIIDT